MKTIKITAETLATLQKLKADMNAATLDAVIKQLISSYMLQECNVKEQDLNKLAECLEDKILNELLRSESFQVQNRGSGNSRKNKKITCKHVGELLKYTKALKNLASEASILIEKGDTKKLGLYIKCIADLAEVLEHSLRELC